jgi:hypothetical protein
VSDDSPGEGPAAPEPFDPYRFGAPDHPIDPAYAPPGYVPPTQPPNTYGQPPGYPQAGPPQGGYGQQPGYGQPYPPGYGQPTGYGQPYGYPPAPNGSPYPGAYPQTRRGNGFAITALVLGILSLLFCWANFIDAVFVIPAVIFAIIGISASKTRGTGKGMAIAGLITAIVGLVLASIFAVYVLRNLHCGDVSNGSGGSSTHCTITSN